MNRFWLSWYAFVIHTLMFLMVCGGHVFASDPASSKQSVARVLHDATASFICADHDREGRDDGQLFGETDPTEEVEESELDFRKPAPDEPTEDDERPPPETIHRMDPKRQWRKNPRRLIVRLDARRGRPKKTPGSDPPSG